MHAGLGRIGLVKMLTTTACLVVMAWRGACTQGEPLLVTHTARALQPGEAVVLSVSSQSPLVAVDATAFGQRVAFFPGDRPGEWQALVGIDLDTPPGVARVAVTARSGDGATLTTVHSLAVVARAFPTRRLRVDPRFVTPPASALPRIQLEQKRLAALLAVVTPERIWNGPFAPPIDGAAGSNFGARSVFNGTNLTPHRGADFAAPLGAPVRSPNAGRVVLAEDLYYSGTTVVLDHGLGVFSLLAHLSRLDVRSGGVVARGEVVGAVGATGRATGPHLHWTLRIGKAAVDPLSVVAVTARVQTPPERPRSPAAGGGAGRRP
jgi:hypothetical protein